MSKIDIDKVMPRKGSGYPEPFRRHAPNRIKKALGEAGGLTDFGVNWVRLPPGEWSSQRHWHSDEDEFVYVIEGEVTLITNAGEQIMRAGDCAAFAKNTPDAHHLINKSGRDALYLEVGSRHEADVCEYPDVDLRSLPKGYVHKDGRPY